MLRSEYHASGNSVPGDHRVIILAVLAAVSANNLPPPIACMRHEVVALESSGESPEDIATATWGVCQVTFIKIASEQGVRTPESMDSVLAYAERRFSPGIVTHVVRMRACRKSPRCNPQTLSWEASLSPQPPTVDTGESYESKLKRAKALAEKQQKAPADNASQGN